MTARRIYRWEDHGHHPTLDIWIDEDADTVKITQGRDLVMMGWDAAEILGRALLDAANDARLP